MGRIPPPYGQLEEELLGSLRERLATVPVLEELGGNAVRESAGAETAIQVRTASGSVWTLLLECRLSASPRDIRHAAERLRMRAVRESHTYCVIGAPFLSEEAMALCAREGVGAVDLGGNCHLAFEAVYLAIQGRKNRFPKSIEKITLSSRRTAMIIRVLLHHGKRKWLGKDLAREASSSTAFVSAVKEYLLKQDWITEESRNWSLKRPEALLRAWAREEERRRAHRLICFSPESPLKIEVRLQEACRRAGVPFALTEFSAASRVAPFSTSRRVTAYMSMRDKGLLGTTGLKEVDSGGNVHLLDVDDGSCLYGAAELNGSIPIVSPIQLYVDLKRAGERGEDASERLMEDVLRARW